MPFIAYNTDDPNAASMGYTNPGVGGVVTVGPLNTGAYAKALGSFFCDQGGTLVIQQSFDYFINAATGSLNPTPHWDVVGYTLGGTAPGTTTAGTAYTIDTDCIAPVLQIVYTNGGTPAAHLRIFLRLISVASRG